MKRFRFVHGDQVAYLPPHANSIVHPDVEFGFITSFNPDRSSAFVRYWGWHRRELRTTANSEATPIDRLVPLMSVPHWQVVEAVIQHVLPHISPDWHQKLQEDPKALYWALQKEYE